MRPNKSELKDSGGVQCLECRPNRTCSTRGRDLFLSCNASEVAGPWVILEGESKVKVVCELLSSAPLWFGLIGDLILNAFLTFNMILLLQTSVGDLALHIIREND